MIKALEYPHRIVRVCALEPVATFGEKAMDSVPILETWIGCKNSIRSDVAKTEIEKLELKKWGGKGRVRQTVYNAPPSFLVKLRNF